MVCYDMSAGCAGVHRLADANTAYSPPCGGGDDDQTRQKLCGWVNRRFGRRCLAVSMEPNSATPLAYRCNIE
jgi:hypothetical protein